ncbi:SRPBCC family protein [Tamlana crocina]|uniref:Transcription activator effector-binding protein n=1 Tax=Tamlana crocina TaxID=393006 RepID=A0ABX1DCK6_9FLAO|nr:SRPBCC family protein [Tamlana crocina]NJX14338.1 transcription activator effector-binding protein [Tamlana crocina]
MKALKYILFLLLIFVIGLAIFIAVQPNEFRFSRSTIIKAPASVVYNKVNDYKNWPSFSPWIEQEPTANLTYGDKTAGVDGSYAWSGEILGEGQMTTLSVNENESIDQHIQFIKPFESESDINWTFEPTDEGTKVTWEMAGKQDFTTKMYTTFAGSIEDMTGPDFERGLFKLDSVVVADMEKYTVTVDGLTEHGGGYYIYNTTSCKIPDLEAKMQEMMPKISNYAIKNNIQMAGAPFTYYHKWDEKNNAVMFSCCVPTTDRVISSESDILTGQIEPFKAIKTTLKGNYSNLKEAWETTMKHITDSDMEFTEDGPMLEVYLTDPMNTPNPADWKTEIYIAVN